MATPRFTLGGANGWPIKEGSVLAYENTNGLFKPAPFDVARNSGGSYVDANGLIQQEYRPNVPRITYSGGRACLMNEEARTNLVTYSEQFDNAAWIKSNASVSANAVASPDGTTTADQIIEDSTTNSHFITETAIAPSAVFAASVFVKDDGSGRFVTFATNGGGVNNAYIVINTSLGTITEEGAGISSSEIIEYGNGFYRASFVFDNTSAGVTGILIGLSNSATPGSRVPSYLGDGSSGVYAWGAQIEAGSYPSTYIKTEGAAATRAAESIQGLNLGNFLGDSEGGLYVDALPFEAVNDFITISDGTNANRVQIGFDTNSNFSYVLGQGGSNIFVEIGATTYSPNTFYKCFAAYQSGDCDAYIDGVNELSASDTFSNLSIDKVSIGDPDNSPAFRGLIHEIKVYDQRPTNAQMETDTQ